MSRPEKIGLDYFPFDIDFFEDEKIEAISGEFGIKGEIATIKLLCSVYRNGYFVQWNDMLKMKISKHSPGISHELLEQIVNRLVKWGFFNENLFNSDKILTSKGIQNRFFQASKRRKTNEDLPYLLVNVCNNRVNVYNMYTKTELMYTKTPQSKVKESKVKESKEENKEKTPNGVQKKDAAKAATLKRKEEFGWSLVPFVELYGKEMIRNFFDYWSEMNIPKTKMRYEQQSTWEVERRLTTWSNREKFNGKSNNNQKATIVDTPGSRKESVRNLAELADGVLREIGRKRNE
jgi:hypothetical protein